MCSVSKDVIEIDEPIVQHTRSDEPIVRRTRSDEPIVRCTRSKMTHAALKTVICRINIMAFLTHQICVWVKGNYKVTIGKKEEELHNEHVSNMVQ